MRFPLAALILALLFCTSAYAQGFLPIARSAPPKGRSMPPSDPAIPDAEQIAAKLDLPWTALRPNYLTIAQKAAWSLSDTAARAAALPPRAVPVAAEAPVSTDAAAQVAPPDETPVAAPAVAGASAPAFRISSYGSVEDPPAADSAVHEDPLTPAAPVADETGSAAPEAAPDPLAGSGEDAPAAENAGAVEGEPEHLPAQFSDGSEQATPRFRLRTTPSEESLPAGDALPDVLPEGAPTADVPADGALINPLQGDLAAGVEKFGLLDGAAGPAADGSDEKINALLAPSGGLIELGQARLAVMPLDTAARFSGQRAPTELDLPSGNPRMPSPSVSSRLSELSRGNTKKKQVALTFDDGPHPAYTSQLLAVLEHYDVPATFFFVGVQSRRHPEWVKMSHQAGHEIASQTYDHFRLPKLPYSEKVHQIDAYQRVIEELTGQTPRFLRPPGGQVDDETAGIARDRGIVIGLWDVALNDTHEGRSADELLKLALKEVRPGSIVLAHDGIQATIDMLPALIEALEAKGYEFVTMSELAAGK